MHDPSLHLHLLAYEETDSIVTGGESQERRLQTSGRTCRQWTRQNELTDLVLSSIDDGGECSLPELEGE